MLQNGHPIWPKGRRDFGTEEVPGGSLEVLYPFSSGALICSVVNTCDEYLVIWIPTNPCFDILDFESFDLD